MLQLYLRWCQIVASAFRCFPDFRPGGYAENVARRPGLVVKEACRQLVLEYFQANGDIRFNVVICAFEYLMIVVKLNSDLR